LNKKEAFASLEAPKVEKISKIISSDYYRKKSWIGEG